MKMVNLPTNETHQHGCVQCGVSSCPLPGLCLCLRCAVAVDYVGTGVSEIELL